MWSISTAPSRDIRPMAMPSKRSSRQLTIRCSSAAAFARSIISRPGCRAGCDVSFSAPWRSEIRRWSSRPAGNFLVMSPLASMPRAARWPSRVGRRPPNSVSSSSPENSRGPASPRSSTPISTVTASWPASTGPRRWNLPTPFPFPSSPRAALPLSTMSGACWSPMRESWKGRFPAVRFMMAVSTPRKRWR